MKKIWNKILPCRLIFTILFNFSSANVYASSTSNSMTDEGTTNIINTIAGVGLGVVDGIVGVLTIFLRVIVIGIMAAVQGVLTAIAYADSDAGLIRFPNTRRYFLQ